MTTDIEHEQHTGVDRRAALKKAAIAAGAVAWATPTIQALTPGVAAAQVGVTNCLPQVTFQVTFVPTFPSCQCVEAFLEVPRNTIPSECCSGHTFLLEGTFGVTGCGPACPGTAVIVSSGLGAGTNRRPCSNPDFGPFFDVLTCAGSADEATVIPTAVIECPDGVEYTFTGDPIVLDCQLGCPLPPLADEPLTLQSESTTTTTTEAEATTSTESTTTTTTEPGATTSTESTTTTTTEPGATTTAESTTTTPEPTTPAPTTPEPTTPAPTTPAPTTPPTTTTEQ